MNLSRWIGFVAMAALSLALAVSAAAVQTKSTTADRVTQASWPLPNADYGNSRSAVGSTIVRSSVGDLGAAWTVPLTARADGSPVVSGGAIYVQDEAGTVIVVDTFGNEM